ncbi:polysaccharide pyruvyl transferase family protein [Microbacterium hominis]|uniref:Polysaccharide pyruvyl transferase family protein n=1 Tax=Microbacterium hominis TaxID=162426 RepID=A0A7D4QKB8_9MICO|nr:polysaccharide pyruvyl transferase family protein [Microbacterium hominis]QKJ20356.1 polysaccharide pyruvyl transferase family protein [Microbacterium hominis]
MSRLSTRDLAISAAFLVGGGVIAALGLAGRVDWAIAALGLLLGLIGVVVRVQFVSRRSRIQEQKAEALEARRAAERTASAARRLEEDLASARRDLASMRREIGSLKGDSGAVSASSTASRAVAETPVTDPGATEELRRFRAGETRRPLGLVGFFGHGNYGDELFVDVFQQHLGSRFDIRIIPDLEAKPYFSRPVEDKVAEVDAIVMGGGDLVQRWSMDPRYFDPTYLRKPLYLAGVGVPVYQNSEKHQEKPHIIHRLTRYFNNPNVRMIGMRDDFSADWVRTKLEPTAPVLSEPDIVCSLDLPAASKPAGAPILGIVTRQRRVDTPDDYSRLEELAEHAKSRGFRIRHIILGTGSVGKRDVANAPALNVSDKEVVYSEDLNDLSRAIGECTVLASMKFHGTVVATMYGIPSIVLVPTNKNRNFMARIGRSDLVASHDSDRLIEIFGERGPAPIAPEQVAMLRNRSTKFMEELRNRLVAEVEEQLGS